MIQGDLSIKKNTRLLFTLVKKELKDKYLGSYLGVTWAFIQPTATIIIFWFIFQVGFKAIPVDGYPFILWLISGMLPWFFFAEALQNATHSVIDYKYLVKNVVFNAGILPIVKIAASLIIHLFFILFMIVMFIIYGYYPNVNYIQLLYYLVCSLALLIALSYITSSLVVFFKDLGHFIAMMLQFGFWITPIFWSITMVPERYHMFIKLNPVFYITEGYRYSMIYRQWFWNFHTQSLYFWIVTILLLITGYFLFKRLSAHFNDVL